MDIDQAMANFARATKHCDNLILVHRGHGGASRGRRDEETSINRAVVVLAVASWQAVAQDFAEACIGAGAPSPGSSLSTQSYALIAGRVRKEIGDFSTPNAENTRRLLRSAGFDPWPCCTWRQHGGRGQGIVQWRPVDVDKRMNEWLRLRHAIAHGHDVLPQVDALQAVRGVTNPPDDPNLRLVDAEDCLSFFRRITGLTAEGLTTHLASS